MTRLLSWLCLPALLLSCQSVEEYYEYPDPEGLSSGVSSSSMASPESSSSFDVLYPSMGVSSEALPAFSSSSALSSGITAGASSSGTAYLSSSSMVGLGLSSKAGVSSSSLSAADAVNMQACAYTENAGTTPRTGTLACAERSYRTVTIGSQVWMGEDLAWLPGVHGASDTSLLSPRFYVAGEKEAVPVQAAKASSAYQAYGALYNWPAAIQACPRGWHLPGDDDWVLLDAVVTGNAWNNADYALFGQARGGSLLDGRYVDVGTSGFWWASESFEDSQSSCWSFLSSQGGAPSAFWEGRARGFSVRCVKDP